MLAIPACKRIRNQQLNGSAVVFNSSVGRLQIPTSENLRFNGQAAKIAAPDRV